MENNIKKLNDIPDICDILHSSQLIDMNTHTNGNLVIPDLYSNNYSLIENSIWHTTINVLLNY